MGKREKSRLSRTKYMAGSMALALLASGALPFTQTSAETKQQDLTGFAKGTYEKQLQFEEKLKNGIKENKIKTYSRALSKRPALVGTKGNDAGVKYALNQLRKAGLDPKVQTYDVYLSHPNSVSVTQTAPFERKLNVMENLKKNTPFKNEVVEGYNAYSPSGNVEGELVYANYGTPEDFETLKMQGVSVKDKIVIVRYGKNFRGVKPDLASQNGAKGVLIYSDPKDDGYVKGPVYPDGPWRPSDAIQRGSILYIYNYPGDPLTPGKASVAGVKRIKAKNADSLPRIPTTPISYGEAKGLLQAMGGKEAPKDWQGGLPFKYHLGSAASKARINLDIEYETKPINDITVTFKGAKYPNEKIVIGGHRDTWTYGASDNISSWATIMETARSLGKLYEQGWRPDRTIVLAGWDGEEYGLLGSTEYAEQHQKDLIKNAVAYINMDGIAGQFFGAGAVPSLNDLIYDVAKNVTEPRSGLSVYDDMLVRNNGEEQEIDKLGSGSDYTAFLQHLGVPSADIGFGVAGGLYHSAYDNTDSVERLFDPGYKHQAAAGRFTGLMALRLANSQVLPLQYSEYAQSVQKLLADVEKDGTLGVDMSHVKAKAQAWEEASKNLETYSQDLLAGDKVKPKQLKQLNKALIQQERDLINPQGLASRSWFKHQIYAPGLTTGYAAQPLPALVEAQEANDPAAFAKTVKQLEKALTKATWTAEEAVE
ncbi:N-acetylated-alpha-linked acidic dipeptidase [Fictibacillus enclensis]|uniref:M28 family metallopeptidase n=1 Tax=Fictibacillus enclensis TaxID=1017270 RepID=UPI000815E80B|nr:M28 family metallopeptidase [Fictibacillus enclensis]SCC28533.1 N-acetylated-alpha-linked acidic dipeptidase [Fictibacillus enclensis]